MDKLFKLKLSQASAVASLLERFVFPVLEKILAFPTLETIYQSTKKALQPGDFPASEVLKVMNLNLSYKEHELTHIPNRGPLIIVANHPFGGVEGLALASLVHKVRPDVKVLANKMLDRIEYLQDLFISIDILDTKQAFKAANALKLRQALNHVKNNGALIIFPAGAVSHFHVRQLKVMDPKWQASVAWLLKKSEAPALPLFIYGRNSLWFNFVGLIHPFLRTLFLPREFAQQMNKTLSLRIGNKISGVQWKGFSSDEALISFLRHRTYLLSSKTTSTIPEYIKKLDHFETIIEAIDPSLLEKEINQLPASQKCLEMGSLEVWWARASEIPNTLQEIGRLRELTFRATGEGTGKKIDLDRFDHFYLHLFLWNRQNTQLIGSYRLGRVDELLKQPGGKKNLYTHTLFHLRSPLFRILSSSLELGRSFVRQEAQKEYLPLMMLWRGIGTFVTLHPQYRYLFGAVSIDASYGTFSRTLIIRHLKKWRFRKDLSQYLKPRTPFRAQAPTEWKPDQTVSPFMDPEELSGLITDVEGTQKKIPVLLKHYLKVGGKLLGFNVDKKFGHVLDGLILVDLLEADPKALEKHLGNTGYQKFINYHKSQKNLSQKNIA